MRHITKESERVDMFCSHCGNPIETGDNFCGYCGNRISSVPNHDVPVDGTVQAASEGSGTLKVERQRSLTGADAARAYKILIDGNESGGIKSGETRDFRLNAGSHRLQFKIDWCSSREVSFFIRANETTLAKCSPAGKGLLSTFSAIADKNNYISVEIC